MSGRQTPIAQLIAPNGPPRHHVRTQGQPDNLLPEAFNVMEARKPWQSPEEARFIEKALPLIINLKNSRQSLLELAESALNGADAMARRLTKQRDYIYGSPERMLVEAWRYRENAGQQIDAYLADTLLLMAFLSKLKTDMAPPLAAKLAPLLLDMQQQYLEP